MNSLQNEDLIFTDNNGNDKAILGVLEGPCADFIDRTRNGRRYSDALWQKVFSNPIVNEMIDSGGVPGELDHPCEREDTDSSRIAILMKEKPVKKHGKLWAKFHILNTPLGKIAYTLAKAGFKLGVSSRGSGDVVQNYDGTEDVDASTYEFKAFDLVLLPAVKSARLSLVTEGLNNSKFNYKQALVESLNEATQEEQAIMKEALNRMNIMLNESVKRVPGGYLHYQEDSEGMNYDVYFESTWNSSYDWKRHDVSKEELDKLLVDKNLNESDLPDDYADKVASGKIIEKYIDLTEPSSQYELDKYLSNGWSIKHQGMTLVILYKEFTNESLNEDVYTIKVAINELRDYLISWQKQHLARELATDVKKAGWDADVERAFINFVNQLVFSDVDRDELINTQETGLHIEESGDMAVEDSEANVVSELQEALKENDDLARTVTSLQEKLSVGYTKEAELQALVDKYTNVIRNLTENAKKVAPLKAKVDVLTEKVENLTSQLSSKDTNIKSLQENVKSQNSGVNVLQEQLDVKEAEVEKLQHSIEMLNEQFGERESSLNQKFEDLKNEYQIKEQSYVKKLNSSTKLVEKYKQVASNAVNTYIESQARLLGVSSNEVKNRLPENYSIKDINTVCENMRSYKLNISKLPFRTNLQENVTLKATASKNDRLASVNKYDVVDDFDLKLANML